MSDKGEFTKLDGVVFRRTLPGPIERVWSFITEPGHLPAWFGENSSIEPQQGGRVSLMGGHIRGLVTQWQPPRKLVYTWNVFGPDDAADAVSKFPESYPTFELEAAGSEVTLTFTHFPVLERFVPQNAMGWHTMLDILVAGLRGDSVKPRLEYMRKNAALYGVDLNNLAG
ncbi:MAG: SRPBCC domain-containing protein [Proteobacteria bacterium]|nr:SRPBCC domain-containing protein [Pseudomonadota bacterium]